MPGEIVVIKLGGSVLAGEASLRRAVHVLYREIRAGRKVVAVASAFADETDRLMATARSLSPRPDVRAFTALVATGESRSSAALALATDAAGIATALLDTHELDLRTSGPVTDAEPFAVDRGRLRSALEHHDLVVVPGFAGRHEGGGVSLLGRGGSDLSAIFIAHALEASCCALVKDVGGWFRSDPTGGCRERFVTLHWDDALGHPARVVQPRAVEVARRLRRRFAIVDLTGEAGTRVGPEATTVTRASSRPRARVVLLGCGVVGGGIYHHLLEAPDRFEVTRILVRDPARVRLPKPPSEIVTDRAATLDFAATDLVVEAIGGIDPAAELVRRALGAGALVVTANKELVASHGQALKALATRTGTALLHSAAVGGSCPMLEAASAHRGRVRELRALLNGTAGFVLTRVASGRTLEEAVSEAREAGFAEADPSDDLTGLDAARKLSLLARAAFGVELDVASIPREAITAESIAGRGPLQQVSTLHRTGGDAVSASIRLEAKGGAPLSELSEEWNGLFLTLDGGAVVTARGRGAGRWPTAEAMYADVVDAAALVALRGACRDEAVVA